MKNFLLTFIGAIFCSVVFSIQPKDSTEISEFEVFTLIKSIPTTSVKNQYRTNTCWSFATLSFVETEILRKQNKVYDLSEMYIVRNVYSQKANKYVRMHGTINFAGGGEANDVLNIIRNKGIITEEAYSGLLSDSAKHNHIELDETLKKYVEGVVENPDEKLTLEWHYDFYAILDSYLGEVPESFNYSDIEYSPFSFSNSLDFNPDDYIMLTSFSHHPFYQPFAIEVPDNWSWEAAYNLPLSVFEEVTKHAINNGYSVVWAADYTENGFMYKNGVALAPQAIYAPQSKKEKKIQNLSKSDYRNSFSLNDLPINEIEVTQELRQEAFDNYLTTDDHGMHIVGLAKDSDGKEYYYVKNSWGTDNPYGGYFFVSEAYFNFKTISIMLHKDAIPDKVRNDLGL